MTLFSNLLTKRCCNWLARLTWNLFNNLAHKARFKFPVSNVVIFSIVHQNSVTFVVSRSCHESVFERFLGTGLWLEERPRKRHSTQHNIKAVTTNSSTPTKIMISDAELESAIDNNVPCFNFDLKQLPSAFTCLTRPQCSDVLQYLILSIHALGAS